MDFRVLNQTHIFQERWKQRDVYNKQFLKNSEKNEFKT